MIPLTHMKGLKVGVLGLGASGLATARALAGAGAAVYVWDDGEAARESAAKAGFQINSLMDEMLDLLVSSPGIPMAYPAPHPVIAHAQSQGTAVCGDVELFAQARGQLPPHHVVSITGTNGKSTTTALIAHILKTAGQTAMIGGNFGPPILSLDPSACIYVLELSSFQLEQTSSLVSDVSVFLNLTPDHEDRYADMASYGAAKRRLFEMQGASGCSIIAIDDQEGRALSAAVKNRCVTVSAERPADWSVQHGRLYCGAAVVAAQADWPDLQGPHNAQNAAAAAGACAALGLSNADIAAGLASFQALNHRSQPVGRRGHVRFINDSKATNPDAVAKSLQAYPAIHWLAGGSDKGSDFDMLAAYLSDVEAAYFFGQTKDKLAADLPTLGAETFATLEEAFAAATGRACASNEAATILLSPACASFDQFKNFAHRGEVFTALVERFVQEAA